MRLEILLIAGGLAAGAAAASAGGPLYFEENRGQTDGRVHYLARCPGYRLFLTQDEAVLGLPGATPPLRLSFIGADSHPAVVGLERLPGVVSYFIGADPDQWVSGAPTFARVELVELYPGVDLVWRGAPGGELEFDLVLASGVDPAVIEMRIDGAWDAQLTDDGALALEVEDGLLVLGAPRVFQEGDAVDGRFVLRPGDDPATWVVGFEVAGHDRARPVLIDPVVAFSTYLGGTAEDYCAAVGFDAAGNAFTAGTTRSLDFPTLPTSFQPTYGGYDEDAFVCKLDPTGQTLLYCTYLGGSGSDVVNAMAVDAAGSAVVVGATTSPDFPLVSAYQSTFYGGLADGLVTRLSAAGTSLTYSTFLGGTSIDQVTGIVIGAGGELVVAGYTGSLDFPLVNPLQAYGGSWADAFAAVLAPGGAALSFSTYYGGSLADYNVQLAVDATGVLHICGLTESPDLPLVNPFQPVFGGSNDGFVAGIVPGFGLAYATYLGSAGFDTAWDIAADAEGNSITVGHSVGGVGFPTTPGALHPTPIAPGGIDMFVTKLAPTGAAVFSTFLGGTGDEFGVSVAVDAHGGIFVGGWTNSTDFPLVNPVQATLPPLPGPGLRDSGIVELSPDGREIRFGTYLGGSGTDGLFDLAVDPAGNLLVGGRTDSTDLPLVSPWQPALAGGMDAFLTRIDRVVHIRSILVSQDPVAPGLTGATVWMDVENTGATSVQVQAAGLRFADATGPDRSLDYVVSLAPASPMTIGAGATETLALLVDVTPGAQLGAITIDGNVQVTDLGTGAGHADHNADVPGAWTVIGALPFVRVVDTAATTVLQGVTGQPLTVLVENVGVSAISVGAVTWTFTGTVDRTTEYTVTPDPGNPTSIPGGATELFTFTVDVSPAASLELITLDAAFAGTDTATMTAVLDTAADTKDTWTVVAGEAFVRVVDTPVTTVLQGTPGHPVTVTVENTGVNPMLVSAVTLSFTGAADRTAEYTVTPDPGNPTSIPGGATELFAFTVDVSPSASLEPITLDAAFAGTDSGSMAAVLDADADTTDTWTVVAGEAFVRVVDTPVTTVLQGTPGHPVTVTVENTGVNPMLVGAVTLSFTGAADRTAEYTVTPDPGNPTSIPGGATELFTFAVDVSPAATIEPITLDAAFAGTDTGSMAAALDAAADTTDTWTVVACLALSCGDCNGDGVTNILDALAAALHAASISTLVGERFSNCNVTGALEPDPGAAVDVLDSLLLAQAAAGLPVSLTCC